MFKTTLIKPLRTACLLLLVIVCSFYTSYTRAAKIIVVSNIDSHISQLTRSQVRQIFMGGTLSRKYRPVVLPVGSDTRNVFNTEVIGLTEHRVQAYWSQLQFTGRAAPPTEFEEVQEVVKYLLTKPNVVAYLPAGTALPKELEVIYEK